MHGPSNPFVTEKRQDSQNRVAGERVGKVGKTKRQTARLADDNNVMYTVIMIRTQISLSADEYQAAKSEAKRLGISLAELLRRSLRTALPVDESAPWMRYAGMLESGDPRSSERIDEIVYGQKP
jgi:hypothetical protein